MTAAAPTPTPRMIRATTMKGTFGARAQDRAPTKNNPAQTSSVLFRPRTSASLPPIRAPAAAPGNSSELTTVASSKAFMLRASFI